LTLFEIFPVLGAFSGLMIGAAIGFQELFIVGAIMGATIGTLVGFFTTVLMIFLLCAGRFWMERRDRRKDLIGHFDTFWSTDKHDAWLALRERVRVDDTIKGVVVGRFKEGYYVDAMVDFPMFIHRMDNTNGFDDPTLDTGAHIDTVVHSFDDKEHIVRLTQRVRGQKQQNSSMAQQRSRF
jgi:hypothetical protein